MEIALYLEPCKDLDQVFRPGQIGSRITRYTKDNFPELKPLDIALIGVPDGRGAIGNEACGAAPDLIKEKLYSYFTGDFELNVADLGNILPGHSPADTYFAVSRVCTDLILNKVIPVLIGGGKDITYGNYLAYKRLEQIINIVSVDSIVEVVDLEQQQDEFNSSSYLSKIILEQPNFLFNYSNLGYQTYLVGQETADLMQKLFFDVYRLGMVRSCIEETEPVIRNADLFTVDISSVKKSEAPGNNFNTPNGLLADEICQMMRYAGLSDKLSSVGIYGINPGSDINGQTVELGAQMIWSFIDGFYNRKFDYPVADKNEYLKYHVTLQESQQEIIFYKSKKSDRWWMDVPYGITTKSKLERHHMVPCSYKDYQEALKEEVPERWWQTYQKLI